MASIMQRITRFLNSSRGKQLVDRGRREWAKPANQQKLRQLADRVKRSRRP